MLGFRLFRQAPWLMRRSPRFVASFALSASIRNSLLPAAAAIAGSVCALGMSSRVNCQEATAQRTKVVVFGDSITQFGYEVGGWVNRLANMYSRRADVLNRGYSGYNTRWGLQVLDQLLSSGVGENVALWTVWLGANDDAMPPTNRTHVPLYEYEENLKLIVGKIRAASPGAEIVVITPPPVDEAKYFAFMRTKDPHATALDRTHLDAGLYASAARRAAATCGVRLLDTYSALQAQDQPASHFLSDGLHLSPAGQELVFKLLRELIEKEMPALAVTPDPKNGSFANSGSTSKLVHEFPWHDRLVAEAPHHPMFAKA